MDISQFESLLAKAKAYDELKVKFAEQAETLAQITNLLVQGGHYPEAPMPVPEATPLTLSPTLSECNTPSFGGVGGGAEDSPSVDSEGFQEVRKREKLPKRTHISGNPRGTDLTHNPCITEDQAILASNQGIRFPKMIVKEGGKGRPDVVAHPDEVWHYGSGTWVAKHSPENPRWKCCLCVHHFENGYCRFPNDCMYAHSEEELLPFTKYIYGR
jgi:hypothetical protein